MSSFLGGVSDGADRNSYAAKSSSILGGDQSGSVVYGGGGGGNVMNPSSSPGMAGSGISGFGSALGSYKPSSNFIEINQQSTEERFAQKFSQVAHLKIEEQKGATVAVGEHLSSGGFGVVYKGTLTFPEKKEELIPVAIKIAKEDSIERSIDEIYREAVHLDRLNKQGCPVVKIYGVMLVKEHANDIEKKPAILMELANHGSFADLLKKSKVMSPDKILYFALYVTRLVGTLHSASPICLHKDVKPGNLLCFDEEGTNIKITDVGLAKSSTHGNTTTAGVGGGTRFYSPPEAFADVPRVSAASDVWMTAVCLAELVSGRKPASFVPDSFSSSSDVIGATIATRDRTLELLPEICAQRGAPAFLLPVIEHGLKTKRTERPCTGRVLHLEVLESAILHGNALDKESIFNAAVIENLLLSGIAKKEEQNLTDAIILKRIEEAVLEEQRRKQKISDYEDLSFQQKAPEIFMAMDRGKVDKAVELIHQASFDQLGDHYVYYFDSKKYPNGIRVRAKNEVDDFDEKRAGCSPTSAAGGGSGGNVTGGGGGGQEQHNEKYFDILREDELLEAAGDRKKCAGQDSSSGNFVAEGGTGSVGGVATSGSGSGGDISPGSCSSSSSSGSPLSITRTLNLSDSSSSPNSTSVTATSSSTLSVPTVTSEKRNITIAHRAVALGQVEVLKALIERKAKCLHEYDEQGFNPLLLSVSCNDPNFEASAVYLLSDPLARDEFKSDLKKSRPHNTNPNLVGCMVVNVAAICSTPKVMQCFLDKHPKEIKRKAGNGLTPLLETVFFENMDVFDLLLENTGKGEWMEQEQTYRDPLVDINEHMDDGTNILFMAIDNRSDPLRVVKRVLDKLRDKLGKSELSEFIRKTRSNKENLLHQCVLKNKTAEVFDFVASHEAVKKEQLFDEKDAQGLSPTQRAMHPMRLPLLEVCAKHGALSMKVMDSSRKSLRVHAQRNKDVAEMIKKYGIE